jgi:hypothetical protein
MRITASTILAATVLLNGTAWAGSSRTDFGVTARVESVCTVGDAQGRVGVRCTRGTAYNLSVNGRVRPVRDGESLLVSGKDANGVVITTITY